MPRKTSEVTDTAFPFAEDTVPFILVVGGDDCVEYTKDGRGYEAAWTPTKKHALVLLAITLREVHIESSLLAVWPGANASHVFEVDDLAEARDALA